MSGESWVHVPAGSDFPLENLPFGMFRRHAIDRPRPGVAIGDRLVDLIALHEAGVMRLRRHEVDATSLNPLLDRLGPIRTRVGELLAVGNEELLPHAGAVLVDQVDVEMLLPVEVGDYVDFYSSEQHATNVGRLFRPDGDPLLPNWKHIPIGYHGRSSTVVVSGTDIRRPLGQRKARDAAAPTFGPSQRLDIELEVGFVTSRSNDLGAPIPVADAEGHIAGLLLVNDWSARDLQAWEYQPLGPFLGKSFATSVSPWLVTMEALEPYRVEAPRQDPDPLPYLVGPARRAVEIDLEVVLNGTVVARTNFADMYWTMDQQLAHAASNGAVVRPGDVFASGTVSGSEPGSYGSLLELTRGGAEPITLDDGTTRSFLEDGDTVELRGSCGGDDRPRIGFGRCVGTVAPAPSSPAAPDTDV
jgi:fumarylacetoacetase